MGDGRGKGRKTGSRGGKGERGGCKESGRGEEGEGRKREGGKREGRVSPE